MVRSLVLGILYDHGPGWAPPQVVGAQPVEGQGAAKQAEGPVPSSKHSPALRDSPQGHRIPNRKGVARTLKSMFIHQVL